MLDKFIRKFQKNLHFLQLCAIFFHFQRILAVTKHNYCMNHIGRSENLYTPSMLTPLDIAVGKYRNTKTWRNKQITRPDLLAKLQTTHYTAEKYAESSITMPDNDRSAIIGFWRQGADFFTIALITGYTDWQVGRVVEEYQKTMSA